MPADRSDARSAIRDALVRDGYTIIRGESCICDPFQWKITARKGEYEIRVEEINAHDLSAS